MSSESRTVVLAATVTNVAITAVKFAAAAITGSAAMLAEAIHSLVDTANGGLILLGLRLSKRPPDEHHPFGHGKEQYVWSLVVGVLVFAVGGGVGVWEGVSHMLRPESPSHPTWSYGVLSTALLFDSVSWYISLKAFRRQTRGKGMFEGIRATKDPSTLAVLLEDSADIAGNAAAMIGIALAQWTRVARFDAAASILVGLILAGVAVVLTREARGLLIGEAAPASTVRDIQEIAAADPHVEAAKAPLTMHLGPDAILVNLDLRFRSDLDAQEIERAVQRLQRNIRARHPEAKRIFIEADAMARPSRPGDGASLARSA